MSPSTGILERVVVASLRFRPPITMLSWSRTRMLVLTLRVLTMGTALPLTRVEPPSTLTSGSSSRVT
ncbi:hypothetical protein D3C72_2185950 [compost metagenome]